MRIGRRGFLFTGVVLGGAALWHCAPSEIEDRRRRLLSGWSSRGALARYRQLELGAGDMLAAFNALANQPSAATLAEAQDAWWSAREPLKQSELWGFGPYSDEPLRLGPKIDFWPARPSSVEQLLAAQTPLTSLDAVGAAAKGFPAAEYLLYQPGLDLVGAFQSDSRRGDYLSALAADMQKRSRELAEAWDPAFGDYQAELTAAGRGSQSFGSLPEALASVVNRMGTFLEFIRQDKLDRPLGRLSAAPADPSLLESRFSGRSLTDIADNLVGLEQALLGDGEIDGLTSYLEHRGYHYQDDFRALLAGVRAALDAIVEPLEAALSAQPDQVALASDRLGDLQHFIQAEVLSALSASVAFSDNDGD